MAWWAWLVVGFLVCFCVLIVLRLLLKRDPSIQVALDKTKTKALQEQLSAERKAHKKTQTELKRFKHQMQASDQQFQQALKDLKKETVTHAKELSSDPDLLDDKLDQLLTSSTNNFPTESKPEEG